MRAFGTIFATLTLAVSASAAAIYPRDTVNNAGGLAALTTTVKDIVSGVSLAKQDVKSRQLPGGNVVSEVTNVLGNTPVGGVAPRQLPGGNVVSEVTNVLGNTPVGGVVPRQLPGVNAGSVVSTVKSVLGNTPVGGVAPRGEQGVPDVINGVIVQIKPILVDIDAKITADVAVQLLTKIKVILADALVSINAIVKVGGSAQLLLDGEVVTVVKLGALVAELIVLIIPALKLVVTLSACVDVIGSIVVVLVAIVDVVVAIGVNVSVDITALISADVVADLAVGIFATLRAVLLIK